MNKQEALKHIMDLPDYAQVTISRDVEKENKGKVDKLISDINNAYMWTPNGPFFFYCHF